MSKNSAGERALVTNRKAFHAYIILERFEAGVSLAGTEVKSIRDGGLSFRDAFVEMRSGEAFLVDCHIAPYSHGNLLNHEPGRDRRLLLRSTELRKLATKVSERGQTIVPLRAYLKNGRIKIEIGLARGKRLHDKREAIKRRDIERDTRQEMKRRR
ncbi:MAG: SsrA-binding protein SmpB [Vicinamibacteria bacterium]|nr:SsrA-binding protein SmpB [Vicinamibacteria bacterium]